MSAGLSVWENCGEQAALGRDYAEDWYALLPAKQPPPSTFCQASSDTVAPHLVAGSVERYSEEVPCQLALVLLDKAEDSLHIVQPTSWRMRSPLEK